jgi:hypothetical protein
MSSIFTTRGDDQIARGAADRLRETGLRVPEDVVLVGFDNWGVIATACRPPLTTVDMNLRQLGRAAGEHLLAAVDGRPGSGLQLLPCGLVIRESSRPAVVAPSMTPVNEGAGRAFVIDAAWQACSRRVVQGPWVNSLVSLWISLPMAVSWWTSRRTAGRGFPAMESMAASRIGSGGICRSRACSSAR